MALPAVAIADAFPVRTADNDKEVGASVVLCEGMQLYGPRVDAHCAANIQYFMVPRYIEFLPELPSTTNQKFEKFSFKQWMEAGLEKVWDREKAGIVLKL